MDAPGQHYHDLQKALNLILLELARQGQRVGTLSDGIVTCDKGAVHVDWTFFLSDEEGAVGVGPSIRHVRVFCQPVKNPYGALPAEGIVFILPQSLRCNTVECIVTETTYHPGIEIRLPDSPKSTT